LFAELYRKISKFDPHIFSLHIPRAQRHDPGARTGAEEAKGEAQVDLWTR